MKKITLTLKMLLFVALLATWSSCSKSDDNEIVGPTPVNPTPNTPDTPTPSEPDDPYMTVCEHVAEVAKNVDFYYDQCHSMAELNKYLEDIKKIEYVEDAYTTNTTMFVKIKDYGKITYSFYPERKSSISRYNIDKKYRRVQASHKKIANHKKTLPKNNHQLGSVKICIAIQEKNDDKFDFLDDVSDLMYDMFDSNGFQVSYEDPTVDFYCNNIFEYDIVYLDTHGCYDPDTGLHWWLTIEEPDNTNRLDPNDLYKYKDIPKDQVIFNRHLEIRNGSEQSCWYAMVSEKWVDSSNKSFKNSGNAILFNGACQSMMGNGVEMDSINYSAARIYQLKGAGLYLGYDQSNDVCDYAATNFFIRLISGMSIEKAYKDIPFDLIHNLKKEKDGKGNVINTYWADLTPLYDPIANPNIKESHITKPTLMEYKKDSYDNGFSITLSASSPLYINYWNHFTNYDSYLDFSKHSLYYGFIWGETNDIEKANIISSSLVDTEECSFKNNMVSFTYTLNYKLGTLGNMILPETTYYYWAYSFDGKDYNISNYGSFTTPKFQNNSGSGELPNVPGSDL